MAHILGLGPRGRLVDREVGLVKRERPMKLLCLGIGRTGTVSMYAALKYLRLKPYHMIEAFKNPTHDLVIWEESLQAKDGNGKPFGRAEFETVLAKFDATMDGPMPILVDELLEAYPEAKVLLTMRDVDKWIKSKHQTIDVTNNWWLNWDVVAKWDGYFAGPWWTMHKHLRKFDYGDNFTDDAAVRKWYLDHYDYVRSKVPKDRLLEHHPSDGWEPLAKFLDIPLEKIPNIPYPHVNDSGDWMDFYTKTWRVAFAKMVAKILAMSLPFVGAVAWYLRGDEIAAYISQLRK